MSVSRSPRPLARVLCLSAVALFVAHAARYRFFLVDDACISLRYAHNLVAGHGFVFNPGERVEGYTNFLWVPAGASGMQEVVADMGYHSTQALVNLEDAGLRAYVSEPDRGRRSWRGNEAGKAAVYANRRRIRGRRSKRLHRLRGERVERSFAHAYETGGLRRIHLRGHQNIIERVLIHIGALNLGILLRKVFGMGTPRGLQGRRGRLLAFFLRRYRLCRPSLSALQRRIRLNGIGDRQRAPYLAASSLKPDVGYSAISTTVCQA